MKLRTKFIIPVVTLLTAAIVITTIMFNIIIKNIVSDHINEAQNKIIEAAENQARLTASMVGKNTQQIAEQSLSQASLFTRQAEIISLYQLANQGNINIENDPTVQKAREKLRNYISPVIKKFLADTGQSELKLHFHLSSNRSFLRCWRSKQTKKNGQWVDVSDSLSSFRNTVVEVNKNLQAIKGIEVGRGGFAIRGITPIQSDTGQHLGTCEVLYSFNDVIKNSKLDKKSNFAAYMNKDLLSIAKKLQNSTKNPIIGNKYVRTATTDKTVTDRLVKSSFLDHGRSGLTSELVDNFYLTAFPILDYSDKQSGVMVLVQDLTAANESLKILKNSSFKNIKQLCWKLVTGGIILLLALAASIYVLMGKLIITPLGGAVSFANQIAEGDITGQLPTKDNDKISKLSRALNHMSENLHEIINSVREKSDELFDSAKYMNSSAKKVSKLSQRGTEDSENIYAIITRAETDLADLSGITHQLNVQSQNISGNSSDMNERVNSVAAAIEEMNASIADVAKHCAQASSVSNQAQDKSESSRKRVERLEASSQQINKIIDDINEIAEQTKLLALNATIEAARAGEAGKGFAVVANEVKDLAQQTETSTNNITTRIQEMQQQTEKAVVDINEIAELNSQVNELNSSISTAVEEQSATVHEIASNISDASTKTNNVYNLITELDKTITEEVTPQIEDTTNFMNDAVKTVDNIKSGSIQTSDEAKGMTSLAKDLSSLAKKLKSKIDYFHLNS